jgi:hypothetical protein
MKNRLILLVVLWTMTLPVRAVTYGTHSTVYTPAVSSPVMHTAAPMVQMRSTSAMPMMTHGTTVSYATSSSGSSSPSRPIGHIRRANPHAGETGTEGDKWQDTENPNIWWYWDEEAEGWVPGNPPIGTIKEEGGVMYEWNGSEWVRKSQIADLGTPVGDAPWLWMLLLLAAYALFLGRKVRTERVNE